MKILQINTTLNSGSTGRIAEQIGAKIIANGYESYIAYSRKGNNSTSNIYQINKQLDVYKHVIETRLFDKHGFSSKQATNKFVDYIDNLKPNIIHLHNIHGYYIHIEVLFDYLLKHNIPIVWTFHDCWAFTGHCAYFDRVDCEKWKTECHECPLTKYYPESWFFDNSKNNFKKKKELFNKPKNIYIITPSLWLKNLVKQSFLSRHSVNVINNGIDLSIFKPIPSNTRDKYNLKDKIILLGVASIWDSRKGLNDFIKLSSSLNNEYQIILVGLTKKQIKVLTSNIIGIERTESLTELVALYNAAAIYLNPTYSDNFPTTNIEALACGTPVITYKTGGSPEAIDESTGIVIEKGDLEGMANAIKKIIDNKTKFNLDHCRKRAETLYDKDNRFDDYINLYKELIVKNEN